MSQFLTSFYHQVVLPYWPFVVSVLGLSGLFQAAKHFFFNKLSPKAIMSLTTLTSVLAAGIQYAMSTVKQNPTVLGTHTVAVLGGMTLAYRYAIGPAYKLMLDAKTYRQTVPVVSGTPAVDPTPTTLPTTTPIPETAGPTEASF